MEVVGIRDDKLLFKLILYLPKPFISGALSSKVMGGFTYFQGNRAHKKSHRQINKLGQHNRYTV